MNLQARAPQKVERNVISLGATQEAPIFARFQANFLTRRAHKVKYGDSIHLRRSGPVDTPIVWRFG